MANFIYILLSIYCMLCGKGFAEKVFQKLCSRIYFDHLRETVTPYANMLNGIYVKTNKSVDNFPVYIHERGNAYFQYSFSKNMFYFSTYGEGINHYTGLSASGNRYLMKSPSRWITNVNNVTRIFGNTLKKWTYADIPSSKRWSTYSIKPKCVPFIADCQSENIMFSVTQTDYKGQLVNDYRIHYFFPIPNLFVNFRQVYKHSNYNISSWYLFYDIHGNWNIGNNYSVPAAFWSVKDNALKPEFITNDWKFFNSHRWIPYRQVKFQCRGIDKQCSNNLCNGGSCLSNIANRSMCTCPIGKAGLTCDKVEKTCDEQLPWGSLFVNKGHGSVAALICPKHSKTSFTVLLCKQNKSMQREWFGDQCENLPTMRPVEPTRRPRPQRPTKPINLDEDIPFGVQIFMKVFITSLPWIIPFIHWWCCSAGSTSGLFRLYSIYCYIGSVTIWLPLIILYAMFRQYGKDFFSDFFIIAWVCLPLSYFVTVLECYYGRASEYIGAEVGDMNAYVSLLVKTRPKILTWVECFHYETRTRIVHYIENGLNMTRTETYQEAVCTWEGSQEYQYSSWEDCSDMNKILNLNPIKMTRVKLNLSIIFNDIETESHFRDASLSFIAKNKDRDTHMNSGVTHEVDGFKERLILYGSGKKRPCWLNRKFYILMTVLHLAWPYRLLLKLLSAKEELIFVKKISINEKASDPSTEALREDLPLLKDLPPPPPYSEKLDIV